MAFTTKEILAFWRSSVYRISAGNGKSIPRILAEREKQTPEQKRSRVKHRAKLVRINNRVVRKARV